MFTPRLVLFLAPLLILFSLVISADDTDEVVDWIQANAIPFTTTDVVEDMNDLECLRELVGDARIVGLGEQTHGTSEFQTMKHRIIQFLVEEMDFTAVILETSWGGGLYADRYVVEDRGSYTGTANALGFWFLRSTEVRYLIDWIHDYNRDVAEQPLHLVAMDYVNPHRALDWCKNILSSAGVTLTSTTVRNIERLPSFASNLYRGTDEDRQTYFEHCRVIMDDILSSLPDAGVSDLDRECILHIPRVLEQLEERWPLDMSLQSPSFNYRDRCMAENVAWWLDVLGEDAKVIVWAHNGHVAADWSEADLIPVGQNLRQAFGDDYISFGFSTCSGTFSAYSGETGDTQKFPIPSPSSNSYEAVLCQTDISHGFIDLRTLESGSPAAEWMRQSHTFKSFGNAAELVDGVVSYAYYWEHNLPNMFDVLIHIHETTGLR
jgi:erythromycin esterase